MTFVPTEGFQLAFLKKLQRLFNEGQFTATYKFALLNAIADLAVEAQDDIDGAMTLSLNLIAEKFIELYWRHSLPFMSATEEPPHILIQNQGIQAGLLTTLSEFREQHRVDTIARLRAHRRWPNLVSQTRQLIIKMPLWKLQFISGSHEDFLYPKTDSTLEIRLNPGIAHCLRLFHPLVIQLVRNNWLEHIRSIPANRSILGNGSDLETFLFGEDRNSLTQAALVLKELQHNTCFYCRGKIHDNAHVDHFIPWARYPRDLGFNFVLAHAKCNADKRDTLASQPHVERWMERNDRFQSEIFGSLSDHFICDSDLTYRVASWSYALDASANARLWEGVNTYTPFQKEIQALIGSTLLKSQIDDPAFRA